MPIKCRARWRVPMLTLGSGDPNPPESPVSLVSSRPATTPTAMKSPKSTSNHAPTSYRNHLTSLRITYPFQARPQFRSAVVYPTHPSPVTLPRAIVHFHPAFVDPPILHTPLPLLAIASVFAYALHVMSCHVRSAIYPGRSVVDLGEDVEPATPCLARIAARGTRPA